MRACVGPAHSRLLAAEKVLAELSVTITPAKAPAVALQLEAASETA